MAVYVEYEVIFEMMEKEIPRRVKGYELNVTPRQLYGY